MEPDFIVIGAQRSGTTSLFRALSEHPDVVRPTTSKGIGYFDVNHHRGPRWYRAHFPLRFGRAGKKTFEISGYYSFHPLAAERIARELPEVKLILVVRDPVDRAHSAHKHEQARGFETEDFETALELEESRLAGEVERIIADPTYESHSHRHHAYVGRGLYADQLERISAVVGRDRIYVVDADRMFRTPEDELGAMFDWLGLRRPDVLHFEKWNARARDPLTPEQRRALSERFADSDRRLVAFMGRTPSWRENTPVS